MKVTKPKQDQILSAMGLKLGDNHISYPKRQFKKYVSQEYRNSERKETDEIYRMFELTLLHNSGLRIVYTTTESYYGDSVEYKVIDIFIISLQQKRLEIVDVDFEKKIFFTRDETVAFEEVDNRSEH